MFIQYFIFFQSVYKQLYIQNKFIKKLFKVHDVQAILYKHSLFLPNIKQPILCQSLSYTTQHTHRLIVSLWGCLLLLLFLISTWFILNIFAKCMICLTYWYFYLDEIKNNHWGKTFYNLIKKKKKLTESLLLDFVIILPFH